MPTNDSRMRSSSASSVFDPVEEVAVSALSTAPQLLWPSTTISLVQFLGLAIAYSMLAMSNGLATLPAVRTTKRSPTLWLNTSSGGTRLSAHESTVMTGDCLPYGALSTLVVRLP